MSRMARAKEEEAVRLCASMSELALAAKRKAQAGDVDGALGVLDQLDGKRRRARSALQAARSALRLDNPRGSG